MTQPNIDQKVSILNILTKTEKKLISTRQEVSNWIGLDCWNL